jgi:predicted DNA-binding transcriptional regulator YafY
MLALLTAAIEGRRLVSIWYDPGVRVIEPHVLGYGSDGQVLLRAFQVAGASASGQPVHWKLFRLDRIRDAKLNGRVFRKPRPEYERDDGAMTRGIIAQI